MLYIISFEKSFQTTLVVYCILKYLVKKCILTNSYVLQLIGLSRPVDCCRNVHIHRCGVDYPCNEIPRCYKNRFRPCLWCCPNGSVGSWLIAVCICEPELKPQLCFWHAAHCCMSSAAKTCSGRRSEYSIIINNSGLITS